MLTALIVMVGCNKREIAQETGYPVQFKGSVLKSGIPAGKVTGTGFDQDEVIGICAYSSQTSMFSVDEFTRFNVAYVQKEAAELVTLNEEPVYFPMDVSVPMNFIGYYPYSDQVSATGILSVDMADQRTMTAPGYLYSDNAKEIVRTANYIPLEFRYVVAQVIVNIKYDPETMPDGDLAKITSVTLEGTGLKTAFDLDVTNGNVTPKGTNLRGSVQMVPAVAQAIANVVPGAVTDLKLNIVTPSHTYSPVPSDITYQAGYQHTYNVTLKGGGDAQISATIVPWEAGNGGGEVIPGEQE